MTIDQMVNELIDEKQKSLPSRFPCRVIMVRNIHRYIELLDKLHDIPGIRFVSSDMLFTAPDVMPRFESLIRNRNTAQWFVLSGVSEYLRLFSKNEASTQRFAKLWSHQAPSSSTGRVIIPLWGCEAQWHDQALHLMDDIRRNEHYYDCTNAEEADSQLAITVFSDSFRNVKKYLASQYDLVLDGMKSWMDYWQKPSLNYRNLAVITARFRNIQSVCGDISVFVIRDTLDYLKGKLEGGNVLSTVNCPTEAQNCLFEYALKEKSLDKAILSCLNIGGFSELDVMGKWGVLSVGQKQLVSLWVHLHKNSSYLCHCVTDANEIQDIEQRILHEIFKLRLSHPEWIAESQDLIKAMKLDKDDVYFKEINQIPEYEDRLPFLSSVSQRERSYLLHMVGMWLREDEVSALENDTVKNIFPALNAYLDGTAYDEDLRRYMKLYKMYKLSNMLPTDEQIYFAGIQPSSYDFRYTVISKNLNDQTVVMWIDALGAEWLPLLIWSIRQNDQWDIKNFSITQANLPTETEFNDQWEQMAVPHEKLNRLDKLAHKGVIDDSNYYSCIEEQLRFVSGISDSVQNLMDNYHRIIITGDHGTSRLAARFFHKRDGVPIGKETKTFSHGRYALISKKVDSTSESQLIVNGRDGNKYLVFANYDHFVKSGFAAGAEDDEPIFGEIHGGATPEEMLVPVLVVDSKEPLPIVASWENNSVKISMRKVRATIVFNQNIENIEVKIGPNAADVYTTDGGCKWSVTFSNITKGTYKPILYADGKLVELGALEVRAALDNLDGDLP